MWVSWLFLSLSPPPHYFFPPSLARLCYMGITYWRWWQAVQGEQMTDFIFPTHISCEILSLLQFHGSTLFGSVGNESLSLAGTYSLHCFFHLLAYRFRKLYITCVQILCICFIWATSAKNAAENDLLCICPWYICTLNAEGNNNQIPVRTAVPIAKWILLFCILYSTFCIMII